VVLGFDLKADETASELFGGYECRAGYVSGSRFETGVEKPKTAAA
jgi:hypothetical protein